ncbi:WXG100 family type VII secretion target [uncultured Actinomyces sp.]|uniref:WXG100 family type VII secretion target n=1 Tax=uncultured Actinomyces sp. TaxID=249061 RepID=UPI002608056F|nr:WXG100 family type VII secretion target [uncultured Actinomyces sp.]
MNGGDFRVSPQVLQQVSGEMRAQAADLLNRLAEFDRDVAARSATWEGAAKESYTQKQAQWNDGMNQMQAALEAFARLVDQLAGNYVTTDQQGEATFNGLGIGR